PRLPTEGETEVIASPEVGGGGLTVTLWVAVVLDPPLPSLTVSAMRCVPMASLTSATAVDAMTAPLSVHENVSWSPFGSDVAVPSSLTVAPVESAASTEAGSVLATAVGKRLSATHERRAVAA